jgi:hypothetical protein
MNKEITTFNDIQITKNNTLIICDIDNTILYYPDCINKCLEIMKDLGDNLTEEEYKKELNDCCNIYKIINKPIHTDYNGFNNMINNIKKYNSKLLFLTARNNSSHNFTKKQLLDLDIFCDENDIHYTNNTISKGEYIKNNININE